MPTGAINGICNLGVGILTGVAGLLYSPVHFSQEEGLKGFFKGGGIGLIMLITLNRRVGLWTRAIGKRSMEFSFSI